MSVKVKQEDVKPDLDAYNIPVEEEELEFSDSMGNTKIWAMKIPGFLFERWERVKASGVHLGTLVVDSSSSTPVITLKLPKETKQENGEGPLRRRDELDTRNIPHEYGVDMPGGLGAQVQNKFIFSEHKRTWVAEPGEAESGAALRKRQKARPRLIGAVNHEVSVRPSNTLEYRRLLAQRRLDSEQSKRPIVRLDDKNTTQAERNKLASGFQNATSTFGKTLSQTTKSKERSTRMDKPELIARMFELFSEKPYWSIAPLKARLQQPDTWLREVLKEIAVQIKDGKYANMWELKDDWKLDGTKGEMKDEGDAKDEEDDDEDDEDDESDMEEVQVV